MCWLAEAIKKNAPRASSPRMTNERYAEIHDLINRGIFRGMLRIELLDGANMITARCVLVMKESEDKEERYMARYVSGELSEYHEKRPCPWN